ncbi:MULTISPECIES: hypothetical protein [unclassified Bradyrhizobium]|uniref:hypothetical protein n=1 Tax=unclassified Bradyrhizobium TaxID=2631580 RepID=UPI0028E30129|nr:MULTISPECIES: hypothetical protein [unclassified Bradyrhizobium]
MAHHLIYVITDRFDPAAEQPDSRTGCPGVAVLRTPDAGLRYDRPREDWGWYAYTANWSYMLGAGGEPESDQDFHWIIAINKRRSLRDHLFRRNKMLAEDELSATFERLLDAQGDFRITAIERDG